MKQDKLVISIRRVDEIPHSRGAELDELNLRIVIKPTMEELQ